MGEAPVAADGKVFFVSEAGKVVVVKAGAMTGKYWLSMTTVKSATLRLQSQVAASIFGPAVPFTPSGWLIR
jgi:hypothetical protein